MFWRNLAGAAGCALLGILAFGRDARVPVLGWIDLCFHEFGHVAAIAFPQLVVAMMGSVTQVAVPLAICAYFLLRHEIVSAMLCLAWAGTSAQDASTYIADAPYERLELIGGAHDWAYALGPQGLDAIASAGTIAAVVHGAGFVMVAVAVGGCLAGPLRRAGMEPAGERALD